MTLREDADKIIRDSVAAAMPDAAVRRALERCAFGSGRLLLTAAGKGGAAHCPKGKGLLGKTAGDNAGYMAYGYPRGLFLVKNRCAVIP